MEFKEFLNSFVILFDVYNFQLFGLFSRYFFSKYVSNLILLWSRNILYVFIIKCRILFVLVNVLCALKNVYSVVEWSFLKILIRLNWFIVFFKISLF